LHVPNELVRGRFLARLKSDIKLHESDVLACFLDPNAESVQKLLQKIVDRQDTFKDNFYSEGAFQSEIESALNTMQDYIAGMNVTAERNVGCGRYDLCIEVPPSPSVVLELKRIRPNAVNYGPMLRAGQHLYLPRAAKWNILQLKSARDLLAQNSAEGLRDLEIIMPDLYNGCVSVRQVEDGAQLQCYEYLKSMPSGTVGFTVVQVGWILLVKRVSAASGTEMNLN
jgi:hypothetical protein